MLLWNPALWRTGYLDNRYAATPAIRAKPVSPMRDPMWRCECRQYPIPETPK